ncbi:MAG: GNAT family N-acetyltransferase [Clostridia bacterium]|nr:GNAT family N-acetyltransferase [Clostridia bacterium]
MNIKNYDEKYREQVRYICKSTGPAEALTDEKTAAYIVNSYCNYYIDNEPDSCFVLTDDSDRAVGYILCSKNYMEYASKFGKYYDTVRKNAGINIVEVKAEHLVLKFFSEKYPAHLHIDILDEYTGHGSGTLLMNTLLSHLKSEGVKAVMLIVGSGNKPAVRFYKRNGFKVLISAFGGTVMGLKLQN